MRMRRGRDGRTSRNWRGRVCRLRPQRTELRKIITSSKEAPRSELQEFLEFGTWILGLGAFDYCAALKVSPISRLPVSSVQPPVGIVVPQVISMPASAP